MEWIAARFVPSFSLFHSLETKKKKKKKRSLSRSRETAEKVKLIILGLDVGKLYKKFQLYLWRLHSAGTGDSFLP